MTGTNDYSPSRVAARLAIQDVEFRWCRAVDRLDYASMADIFHPDAYDDHGPYRGDVPGMIEWLRNRHRFISFSMHQVSNMLIEFADEDNALVELYLTVTQRYAPGAAGSLSQLVDTPFREDRNVDLVSRSRYVDRMQRRDGEWKVLRRTLVQDWKQITELESAPANSPGALLGQRDLDDFIFRERRAMGLSH